MADKFNMEILYERCINCNLCLKACPVKIFKIEENFMIIDNQYQKFCLNCNNCISVCPRDAILKDNIADIGIAGNVLSKDFTCSPEQFTNLLLNLRPVHNFTPDILSKQEKDYLVRVISLAPRNGYNDEIRNTGIIVVEDKELLAKIEQYTYLYLGLLRKSMTSIWQKIPNAINPKLQKNLNATLSQINLILDAHQNGVNLVTFNAPNLIILHAVNHNPDAGANATIMGYQLTLGAEALDLGLSFLSWVSLALQSMMIKKSNELHRIDSRLAIPKNRQIQSVFAIGKKVVRYRKLKKPVEDPAGFSII